MSKSITELNQQDIPEDILSLKASNKRATKIADSLARTVELLNSGIHPNEILKELTREDK